MNSSNQQQGFQRWFTFSPITTGQLLHQPLTNVSVNRPYRVPTCTNTNSHVDHKTRPLSYHPQKNTNTVARRTAASPKTTTEKHRRTNSSRTTKNDGNFCTARYVVSLLLRSLTARSQPTPTCPVSDLQKTEFIGANWSQLLRKTALPPHVFHPSVCTYNCDHQCSTPTTVCINCHAAKWRDKQRQAKITNNT